MGIRSHRLLLPLQPTAFLEDTQDHSSATGTINTSKMYSLSKSIIHGFKNSSTATSHAEASSTGKVAESPSSNDSTSSFFPLFQSSSHELKRFLRPGGTATKPKHQHHPLNTTTTDSIKSAPIKEVGKDDSKTAAAAGDHHHHHLHHQEEDQGSSSNFTVLDFDDIKDKYGEIGKLLGSGANGSVNIVERQSDHSKYAIKQFRARQQRESTTRYFKRCNQEYLIGSSLKHCNIVDIIDFIMVKDESASSYRNNNNSNSNSNRYLYYEIMEFLPVDLFNVVMSNEMSRFEINCCFKQLLEAVTFLHEQGIAHRDLKLDNCCMTSDGILKLIDFGSSFVFQYPFEPTTIKASGVMGSDPYLSPELYAPDDSGFTQGKYDAAKLDVWSLAIVYCCMILRRFPWKCPRVSDSNFKSFLMPDNEPHNYSTSATTHEQLVEQRRHLRDIGEDPSQIKFPDHLRQTIHPKDLHGPYKLFRLLPHGCRPIISQMLAIEPNDRPTMKQIMQDSWVQQINNCTVDPVSKTTVRAKCHHHTVVIGDMPPYKV